MIFDLIKTFDLMLDINRIIMGHQKAWYNSYWEQDYVKELQKETGWAENGVIADSW